MRFSGNGASSDVGATATSVGDFTNLLLAINPTYAEFGFSSTWTQHVVTMTGLGGPVSGRLAFRYVAPDTNTNGDYIGIDTLSVDEAVSGVPEPSTTGLLVGGISLLVLRLRRKAARSNHDAN